MMATLQETLQERARALLEDGTVCAVIGWETGRFANQTTPFVCLTPEDATRLAFNEYCVNTLAKYVQDLKRRGRIAVVVRGCDARAVNRMIQDNQFKREDVYLLGIGCPRMKDRTTGDVLEKCAYCEHLNPPIYDEMLNEPVAEEPLKNAHDYIAQLETLSREERQAFFDEMYEKCIRCYACRDACPVCTCRSCFVDSRAVGWIGKQNNLTENRFYGITRAFHVSDRCIGCGECERVCPMGLPLMTLNRKLSKDMEDLFGKSESGMTSENVDALNHFSRDDVEEFM